MTYEGCVRHIKDVDRAVLFIHGFLGSPRRFDRLIESVPQDCAVYNILLQGHGGTVRDFAKASMKIWKKQVSDVVDELAKSYSEIVIVGHSMGALLAIEEAAEETDAIEAAFLMQPPLKISVKFAAVKNSINTILEKISEEDEEGRGFCEPRSIIIKNRLWEYIGWIPRYLELFAESRKARKTIVKIEKPCHIFMSAKDELVSIKSLRYIPEKANICADVLENSTHVIYSEADFKRMEECLRKLLTDKGEKDRF